MTGESPTLYLVDDDSSVRNALSRLLRSSGISTVTFADAESLLAAELEENHSCIISDIRMPVTSGLEIPERLAARGLAIPIIFLTAYDSPETRSKAQAAGASAYFRKPVDDQALLDAIAWATTHQRPLQPESRIQNHEES